MLLTPQDAGPLATASHLAHPLPMLGSLLVVTMPCVPLGCTLLTFHPANNTFQVSVVCLPPHSLCSPRAGTMAGSSLGYLHLKRGLAQSDTHCLMLTGQMNEWMAINPLGTQNSPWSGRQAEGQAEIQAGNIQRGVGGQEEKQA